MFTVKHIQDDGIEVTFQSARVVFIPYRLGRFHGDVVLCHAKDGVDEEPVMLGGGMVYVMNESGKTVSDYVMCTPPASDNSEG